MEEKKCKWCKEVQPLEAFRKAGSRAPDGRRAVCKECTKPERAAAYKAKVEALEKEGLRECNHCDQVKPLEEFSSKTQCKPCRAAVNTVWVQNNSDKRKVTRARWRERNPGEAGDYYRRHPEKCNAKTANYRARKKKASLVPMGNYFLQALFEFYGGCLNPNCPGDYKTLTHDHVVALNNGGLHYYDNLQVLCNRCNSSKQDRHHTDYRDWSKGILADTIRT